MHGPANFQHVQHRQRFVHTCSHCLLCLPLAFAECEVQALARFVSKGMGCELTKCGVQNTAADFFNQRFMAAAVFNQRSNRADFEAMFSCKNQQVRQPRHGAVVVHDLANNRSGRTVRHCCQIATRLSVTSPHQYAAINGLQRKDMTGLNQITGAGVFTNGSLHGTRPVSCRYACCHAFGSLD